MTCTTPKTPSIKDRGIRRAPLFENGPGKASQGIALGIALWGALGLAACSRKNEEKPAGLAPLPGEPSAPAPAPAAPPPSPTRGTPPSEAPAPAGPPIEGVLELPAARKRDVAPTDTIFLVARTISETPGVRGSLVAVKRFTAGSFPIPFTLGPQDMMFGGGSFSGELTITARVDKDNDPMTHKKGDVFGSADHVKAGSKGVKVVLSEMQKEDESLLGATTMAPGMSPHAGMPGAGAGMPGAVPQGHPPLPAGHP